MFWDIVAKIPSNDYLNTLIKEGIIPSIVNHKKKFVGTDDEYDYNNFLHYIRDNHIPCINLGDNRFKTSCFDYIYPVSGEKARELEEAYNNYNLVATGRTFLSKIVREYQYIYSTEFIYKGKKYARDYNWGGEWHEVLPIEFIVDYQAKDVISTTPICDSSIGRDNFKLDLKSRLECPPFNGNYLDFNIRNEVYTIQNGVMYDSFKKSGFVPYGVNKIIATCEGRTDYIVIPETVKEMIFKNGFTGSLYTKHLELHDDMTFGTYVKLFVNGEVVIHFKHPDSLKEYMKNFSKVVNKEATKVKKFKDIFSSLRLRVILRGPVLSKQDINELEKNYGYRYKFKFPSKKKPETSSAYEYIYMVDNVDSPNSDIQNPFQEKINELTDEIMRYLSYFSDGEQRYNTIKQRADGFKGELTKILANDNHKSSDRVKTIVDDKYNQIIKFLEKEKDELSKFGDNYEAIDFVNTCDDIVHGKVSVSDNDTCKALIDYIKKTSKLDKCMQALIIANLAAILEKEREVIQNYLGSQNSQTNIDLDSISLNHDAIQCEAFLNVEFSGVFKKIDDALAAKSVRETMRNDLFDTFQDNFDAPKRKYTEFYKITSNQISLNIKEKVGDNSDLKYFLDLRGKIVNFFFASDITSNPNEFAIALLSEFPELFSNIENTIFFQMAFDTKKVNLMFNNEELESLVEKYSYMTAALMLLETKLDAELENLKKIQDYSGLVIPEFKQKNRK